MVSQQPSSLQKQLQASRILDLSQTLAEEVPTTWPGHMPYQHRLYNWYAPISGPAGQKILSAAPYQTNYMIIDEHTGTHFDAPTHFIPPPDSGLPAAGPLGTMNAADVPLDWLQGPAVVVDLSHLPNEQNGISVWMTAKHVQDWEAQNGALQSGDVLLLRTGWDKYYVEGSEGDNYMARPLRKEFPGWPAPSADLAEYCVSKGIHCLGVDAPSIGATHDGISAHRAGLSKGLLYVESLTNLDKLPIRGAFFVFLPVKIANSSGGPGRAIAYL